MQLSDWGWPMLAAFVSTTYFFLIKEYVNNRNPLIILSVIALELLVIYLYFKSLEHTRSGIIYAVINGFSVMMGAFIAVFFFQENLKISDIVGIIAIIIGIMLVGKK